MTRLITVPGIGERPGADLLNVQRVLLPGWDHTVISWSASYGPVNAHGNPWGISFEGAVIDGTTKLRAELDRDPAMVVGYSGGAAVAGHVAAQGHRNLRAVGLVSDPFAPGNPLIHGIAGRRPIAGVPSRWVSHRDDVICCCPHDSPLRTLADASAAMSLADPAGWGLDIITRLRSGRMSALIRHPWDLPREWRRFDTAITDACGYLGIDRRTLAVRRGHNTHTVYGWRGPQQNGLTYLQELAAWLKTQ